MSIYWYDPGAKMKSRETVIPENFGQVRYEGSSSACNRLD